MDIDQYNSSATTCSLLFWRCDMDKTSVGYNYEILCETWEKHRDNKHFHTNNAYRPMLQEAQRRHFAAEQLGLHMRFIWWIYSWVMTTTKIGQRNFWWLFHHSRRHTVYFPLRLWVFVSLIHIFRCHDFYSSNWFRPTSIQSCSYIVETGAWPVFLFKKCCKKLILAEKYFMKYFKNGSGNI